MKNMGKLAANIFCCLSLASAPVVMAEDEKPEDHMIRAGEPVKTERKGSARRFGNTHVPVEAMVHQPDANVLAEAGYVLDDVGHHMDTMSWSKEKRLLKKVYKDLAATIDVVQENQESLELADSYYSDHVDGNADDQAIMNAISELDVQHEKLQSVRVELGELLSRTQGRVNSALKNLAVDVDVVNGKKTLKFHSFNQVNDILDALGARYLTPLDSALEVIRQRSNQLQTLKNK